MFILFLLCFVMILFFAAALGLKKPGETECKKEGCCSGLCGKNDDGVSRVLPHNNLIIKGYSND